MIGAASLQLSAQTASVNVGDATIHYELSGTGKTVVLIHGWAQDLTIWDDQVMALSPTYRVLRYDRRSYGSSTGHADPTADPDDLRILLGWAWTWLVIAELIGVKSGLTEFIETQGRFRNFDRVFPVIILIGVTGFVTDQILSWLHGVLFPWTGKSGALSRAVAKALSWPFKAISTGLRSRAASLESTRLAATRNEMP